MQDWPIGMPYHRSSDVFILWSILIELDIGINGFFNLHNITSVHELNVDLNAWRNSNLAPKFRTLYTKQTTFKNIYIRNMFVKGLNTR